MNDTPEVLKDQVRSYWNSQPCGTQFADSATYSREYFDEIEDVRYRREPEIFSFAQFTRHHGERVLEVGVGAGSDFTQWVRAGAIATGIDATPEGVQHVEKRLAAYGLHAERVLVADCEQLPFADGEFDLVYSWGVIHHTPDTERALREIVRVCRSGGRAKVMVYHRHSILAYFFWVRHALLAGKPFRSLRSVLWHHMESTGTKAYTASEVAGMLADQPVTDVVIRPVLTFYDRMDRHGAALRWLARITAALLGRDRAGWFLTIEFRKR